MDMKEFEHRIKAIDQHLANLAREIDHRVNDLNNLKRDVARSQAVSSQRQQTQDLNPVVIRRVVSKDGAKAITFAFKLMHDQNQILVGVCDSGTVSPFIKKVGVEIAKQRIGMIVVNSPTRLSASSPLVTTLCRACDVEESYESLSKFLRPVVTHYNRLRDE